MDDQLRRTRVYIDQAGAMAYVYANGTYYPMPGTSLPTQSGNAGALLTTDGTNTAWTEIIDGGSY